MNKEFIEYRKNLVTKYHLEGYSTREIAQALVDEGCINPDTGGKFSHGTIANDLQEIKQEWQKTSFKDLIEFKAQHLAELRLVKKKAWAEQQYKVVLNALMQEAKILGLDAPSKIQTEHSFSGDATQEILDKLDSYLVRNNETITLDG